MKANSAKAKQLAQSGWSKDSLDTQKVIQVLKSINTSTDTSLPMMIKN